MASLIGKRLEQLLTTSLPMVTTQRLAKVIPLIIRETGGLEAMKVDPIKWHQLGGLKGMVPKELLLPHPLRSRANTSPS